MRLNTWQAELTCGLLCVLATLAAPTAAQTPFTHKGIDGLHPPSSVLPNESVDPASGALTVVATDLVLPGNAGLNLAVTRVYNSAVFPDYHSGGSTALEEDSWAGIGWTLHFGRVIQPDSTNPGDTQIEMGDGRRHRLYHSIAAPGLWTTTEFWLYDKSNHTLKLPSGVVYTFGRAVFVNARLGTMRYVTEIKDPWNNRLTFTYFDSNGPPDGIQKITQVLSGTQTREVTFTYDSTLKALSTMTYLGYTWTYLQDAAGPAGYSVLRGVSLPSPITTRWGYDYTSGKTGEMTKVTTPSGGHLTYAYGDKTREAGGNSRLARVVTTRVIDGPELGGGTWAYDYGAGPNHDTTTVTCPCGTKVGSTQRTRVTKYTFNGTGTSADFSGWKAGTMAFITVEENDTVLEQRVLTYIPGATVSNDAVPGEGGVWSDTAVRTALPESVTTTRGTQSWITTNEYRATDYKDYGRPWRVWLQEDIYHYRRTDFTYQYGFTPYIIGGVKSAEMTVLDGYGNSTTQAVGRSWSYDLATGFLQSQNLNGIVTTFGPTTTGNVATVTNGLGRMTTMAYSWGRVASVQSAMASTTGTTTTYTVLPEGLIQSETTNGLTTSYTYDPAMRIQEVRPPGWTASKSNKTTYTYDNIQSQYVIATRGPSVVTSSLDGFGQVWMSQDQFGVKSRVQTDACGRATFSSYPFTTGSGTRGTTTRIDGLGRTVDVTDALGKVMSYSYSGIDVVRTETPIDGQPSRMTAFDYRAYGDPANAQLMSVTDANAKVTSYTYSIAGPLKSVTGPNPGVTRTWAINDRGLPDSDTQPESGLTTYTYDAIGNLKTTTDAAGQLTTLHYDNDNRLYHRDAPGTADDVTITFANGRATSLAGGGTTTTFDFEAGTGRTIKRTDVTAAAGTFISQYEYDNDDNVFKLTYPSGRIVNYDYSSGRLTTVRQNGATFAQNFHWDTSGRFDSYQTGAVTHTFTFDDINRVYTLVSGATGAAEANRLNLTYGYDNVSNVKSITDPRPNGSQSFALDVLDRLKTATGPWGTQTWTYDNAGNRLTEVNNGATTTYTYQPTGTQRLASTSGGANETFSYTANGELSSDGLISNYTYLPSGKLSAASNATMSATYSYDAGGSRLTQNVNGTATYFLRALSGETLSEYVSPCGATRIWARDIIYAGGKPLGAVKATTVQPTVSLTTAAVSVGESGSATVNVQLTTPNGAALGCPVTVNLLTSAGTATAGVDYTTTSGSIQFAANSASGSVQAISVPIAPDTTDEPNETFTINLTGATGAVLGTISATVTIVDDDPPHATMATSAVSVNETAASVNVLVTLMSAGPLASAVSATWDTWPYTATAGNDYQTSTGTVTFPQGSVTGAQQTITVPLIGDGLYEGSEQFTVRLLNGTGVVLDNPTFTMVTIVDNDPVPNPRTVLGTPADGAVTGSNVVITGYAVDLAVSSGTGVDIVSVYYYPNADESQPAVLLGTATLGINRPDAAAAYGSQFAYSGYTFNGVLPGPGVYRLKTFGHSVLGPWTAAVGHNITVGPTPRMWLDVPVSGTIAQTFTLAGWAIDAGAASGPGVDVVQAWATPTSGAPAVFLGTATYGGSRPDVGASFGGQFTPSGFGLTTSVSPGSYYISVYARSTVTGTFNQVQTITVTVVGGLQRALNLPYNNSTVSRPFTVSGWALDASSPTGTGVDTLHIYAYPSGGGPAIFLGVATYGVPRGDVGTWLQSSRFTPTGFTFSASGLSPGNYLLAVFPHSSYTGTFGAAMTATISVQ